MERKERIKESYIDYVLTQGERPKSVYAFMKKLRLKESEFYQHYASFEAVESGIWLDIFNQTSTTIKAQEEYPAFSAREKMLTFFYAFTEALKPYRSFILYSFRSFPYVGTSPVLKPVKNSFMTFCEEVIRDGIEARELKDRKYIADKYKDALWLQLAFVIRFWVKDNSKDFEKTDEAIEKGLQVTFDMMGQGAFDHLFEYGKFLFNNARWAYERAR